MKALTVCQPYAELIASGVKIIENRTWPTPYRGPLAIHAGKSRAWLSDNDAEDYGIVADLIPFGAVVAIADLVDCRRFDDLSRELQRHEHADGPWCWVLANVRRVEPVPFRGAQGLFDIPDTVLAAASSVDQKEPR